MRTKGISLILGLCMVAGCAIEQPTKSGNKLLSTEELPDKSLLFHYRNGASCLKRADYTEYHKSSGAIAIKELFEVKADFEKKWLSAKQVSPRFEELEAVFFDICQNYGEERLTLEEYKEERVVYNKIRARLMGLAKKPHITKALVAKLSETKSKNFLSIDVTVRNPSEEIVQLDDAALEFMLNQFSKEFGVGTSYTVPSQNYTFRWSDEKDATVSTGSSHSLEYPGEVKVEEDCSRISLKTPVSQTIKPNDVDRFTINIQMPSDNKCLNDMDYDNAKLTIHYNGSETTDDYKITLKRYSVHVWGSPNRLLNIEDLFYKGYENKRCPGETCS